MPSITRQELFDAAWDRPLLKVAAGLGITSTALKKTCRRHHIPTPGRGYWAAVAAGGVFPKPRLEPVTDARLQTVHITGGMKPPEVAVKARAAARQKIAGTPQQRSPTGGAPDPPAVLAATRRALDRARPGATGFVSVSGSGLVPVTVSPASAGRAMDWLASFVRFAQGQGARLQSTEDGAGLVVDGEPIAFRIEEKHQRTPHVPTAKELAVRKERDSWGSHAVSWAKYDHAPSGLLSIIIDGNSYSGLRRSFADGRSQRLEAITAHIFTAFAGHASLSQERRLKAQEEARLAALAAARRRRLQAYEAREKRRLEFVDLVATKLKERAKLSEVLAHVEGSDPGESARLAAMAGWLRRRVAETDALLSPLFLDISARSAKVDFEEARPAGTAEESWHYQPAVALQLWSIDGHKGQAHSQSVLEWALDAGLIADPGAAPAEEGGGGQAGVGREPPQ